MKIIGIDNVVRNGGKYWYVTRRLVTGCNYVDNEGVAKWIHTKLIVTILK